MLVSNFTTIFQGYELVKMGAQMGNNYLGDFMSSHEAALKN